MPTDTISLALSPDAARLSSTTLAYIERMRVPGAPYGRYLYAEGMAVPVLYASSYAAMTRSVRGQGKGDCIGGHRCSLHLGLLKMRYVLRLSLPVYHPARGLSSKQICCPYILRGASV